MSLENEVETDVLVIGGGVAGCFAAIKARERGVSVILVDKGYASKSGATIAAPGWWMVYNPEWGHELDTCVNFINSRSEYINNREWSEIILKGSWATYEDLVAWGAEFPVESDRIKDYESKEIIRGRHPKISPYGSVPLRRRKYQPAMRKQAVKSGVKIVDRVMMTDLLKQDERVVGAVGFSLESSDLYVFKAKATIVSAGNNSFKPPGFKVSCLTGDSDGMAYRAGAEITGKEFPDLHFNLANYPSWRGGDGLYAAYWYFTDAEGNEIKRVSGLSQAFAIHAGKGPVIWDFDAATGEDVKAMQEYTRKQDDALEQERIGLHVANGGKYPIIGGSSAGYAASQTAGIWPVNTKCAASLPGLYAAGDCCCTWWGDIWGLTSAAVTGTRAGLGAAEYALQAKEPMIDEGEITRLKKVVYTSIERKGGFSPKWVTQLLQNTMMPYFILHIKHGERLRAALTIVEFFRDHLVPNLVAKDAHELRLAHETKNMVLNAEMILRSSLFRTESRGVHYREDYPRRDDPTWLAWVKMKEERGAMKLWRESIPEKWWPDLSKPYEERYPSRFPGE